MLIKIISGGQNGVDIAAVRAAKASGLEYGGTMPAGWRTLAGPRPHYATEYSMTEHKSAAYPPRTYQNVSDADGTLRIAVDLDSTGEKCTLKAIVAYGKPHFDVHVGDVSKFEIVEAYHPKTVAAWIVENGIRILNVAGNSEKTAPGIEVFAERYVKAVIREAKSLGW
jgi:hypothetical protein